MLFSDFPFAPAIRQALDASGYTTPTPIQAAAIPTVLSGRDVVGCAQTGTGKTAAFALPIIQRLLDSFAAARQEGGRGAPRKRIRTLIVAPTRELAEQIRASILRYSAGTPLRSWAIYGGVGMGAQITALRRGIDVLVACPGRLLDLYQQGHVDLSAVDTLVLDEADRMLDMGFVPDIERIIAKLPARSQTLLFSATMPPTIRRLAERYLDDPADIAVAPQATAAETVSQFVCHVDRDRKTDLLTDLLTDEPVSKAVVFTRTKHGADRLARRLDKSGIRCQAIHGDKSQGARTRAITDFTSGRIAVLVASDIAARGLDVAGISHVVNFDLPHEPETYVHRIGRCGRAGASGVAWSLCAPEEHSQLRAIQRCIDLQITVLERPHSLPTPSLTPPPSSGGGRGRPRRNRRPAQRQRNDGQQASRPAQRQRKDGQQAGGRGPAQRHRQRD